MAQKIESDVAKINLVLIVEIFFFYNLPRSMINASLVIRLKTKIVVIWNDKKMQYK